jgi:hypothetical protein
VKPTKECPMTHTLRAAILATLRRLYPRPSIVYLW